MLSLISLEALGAGSPPPRGPGGGDGFTISTYYGPGGGGGSFPGHPGGGGGTFMGMTPQQARMAQPRQAPPRPLAAPVVYSTPKLSSRHESVYAAFPTPRSIEERDAFLSTLRSPVAPVQKLYLSGTHPEHRASLKNAYENLTRFSSLVTHRGDMLSSSTRDMVMDMSYEVIRHATASSQESLGRSPYYSSEPTAMQAAHEDFHSYIRLSDDLLSLAMGLNPITSVGANAYEFISGRRMGSGARLDDIDRSLALAGVMTLGIANRLPAMARVVIRLARRISALDTQRHAIGDFPAVQAHADHIAEGSDMLRVLREPVGLLREHATPLANRREVITAFTRNSRVRTLDEDLLVRRYWIEGEGGSLPRGRWVVPRDQSVPDPLSDLALWREGPYRVENWTIPRGTRIIEGGAGPNFGQPGGANQIYVPNPEVLF